MVSAATLPELYGSSTGHTPFLIASWEGHFSICQLLASHGALTDPATGHVSQAMVNRETRKCSDLPGLLEHMETALATHHTFLHVVLRASIILPAAAVNQQQQQQQQQEKLEGGRGGDTSTSSADLIISGSCLLPLLPREILKRVGSWLGVEVQRGLRNVQELVEALAVVEPAADSADEEEEDEEDEEDEVGNGDKEDKCSSRRARKALRTARVRRACGERGDRDRDLDRERDRSRNPRRSSQSRTFPGGNPGSRVPRAGSGCERIAH